MYLRVRRDTGQECGAVGITRRVVDEAIPPRPIDLTDEEVLRLCVVAIACLSVKKRQTRITSQVSTAAVRRQKADPQRLVIVTAVQAGQVAESPGVAADCR